MSEQPFGTETEPAGTSPGVPEDAAPAAEPAPEPQPGVVTPEPTDYNRPGRAEVHALIPANHPQWFRDVIDTLLNIIENRPPGN